MATVAWESTAAHRHFTSHSFLSVLPGLAERDRVSLSLLSVVAVDLGDHGDRGDRGQVAVWASGT